MITIGIFYFSGTGNTELVAHIIRERFSGLNCKVDLLRMEDIKKVGLHVDPDQYDYLGIGCQVIGFGVPRLAAEFIRELPRAYGKKTFLFRTAGGVAPVNYNASKPIIRELTEKGYDVFYERIFSIGSNWVVKFDDSIVRQLFDATKGKAELMCEEILKGEQRILKTGARLRLQMSVIQRLSSGLLRFMGKDLVVDPCCTHCGSCIRNCPAGNIYEKGGKIRFKNSCSGCMRCVYSCPSHAIRFRLLTFFPVKGGYNVLESLNGSCESIPDSGIEKKTSGDVRIPPFFHDYVSNSNL